MPFRHAYRQTFSFTRSMDLYAQRHSWFSRYLAPPVRDLLDAGPAAESALRAPRHSNACILFTDIRGFTELSRTISAAALMEAVDGHLGGQAESIERHGGYIDNFTGDGVMAVFEGGDMEENACQCALEVAEMAQNQPYQTHHDPVPVGVGLHVGEVVMGTLGCESRLTYTAIGETVNVAARLCDHAKGPAVLTTDSVRSRALSMAGIAFDSCQANAPTGVDADLSLYWLRREANGG
jgi:class 3 adenylate cyclase